MGCENVSHGLDMNVINCKVTRETREKETNLVDGGDIEEEDGVGELVLDDVIPEPLHRSTVGDIGRIGRTSTTSELSDEVAVDTDDGSSRIATSRERT